MCSECQAANDRQTGLNPKWAEMFNLRANCTDVYLHQSWFDVRYERISDDQLTFC